MLLVSCGGGGGGGDGNIPTPGLADTQTLPTARAALDALRATYWLANDTQNIIVFAPALVARGDVDENCDQGGLLQTRVLRTAADPAGPLVRQQFDNCRTRGLTIQGVTEINYTRSTTEASDQPWAGSIRFTGYAISSPTWRRAYDGLVAAEGRLTGPAGGVPPLRVQLTDFRLQDTPDTLQRGVSSITRSFRLERSSTVDSTYRLSGDWLQQADGLRVELTFAAGSELPLLDDSNAAPATGNIRWTDTVLPSFSGNFTISPAGRTGLRVQLDLGADGSLDRDLALDRYTQIGFSL